MAGRERIAVYEYNKDGSYIRKFDCISDYKEVHFPDIPTKPTFWRTYKGYRYQITGETIALDGRPGREFIILLYKISQSKFCNLNRSSGDSKPVEVVNLKGEVLAEYKTARIAALMNPQINNVTIDGQLKRKKGTIKHFGDIELFFRYKK